MLIRMLNELEKKTDENSEDFKNEIESIKMNQSELKNTIVEMKNILEGINSRLGDKQTCSGKQSKGNHPIRTAKRKNFKK